SFFDPIRENIFYISPGFKAYLGKLYFTSFQWLGAKTPTRRASRVDLPAWGGKSVASPRLHFLPPPTRGGRRFGATAENRRVGGRGLERLRGFSIHSATQSTLEKADGGRS